MTPGKFLSKIGRPKRGDSKEKKTEDSKVQDQVPKPESENSYQEKRKSSKQSIISNAIPEVTEEIKKKLKPTHGEKSSKEDFLATIVGVLSLPENVCNERKHAELLRAKESLADPQLEKEAMAYHDLRNCLESCIQKSSLNK